MKLLGDPRKLKSIDFTVSYVIELKKLFSFFDNLISIKQEIFGKHIQKHLPSISCNGTVEKFITP